MAVKRRTVWLDDEAWTILAKIGAGKATRSQVVTTLVRTVNATQDIMRSPDWPPNVEAARATLHPVGEPDRRRVDVDSGQSRRIEDQEKIQALSGPPTLAETKRMRAAASRAFGQFRPAPKPGKR